MTKEKDRNEMNSESFQNGGYVDFDQVNSSYRVHDLASLIKRHNDLKNINQQLQRKVEELVKK